MVQADRIHMCQQDRQRKGEREIGEEGEEAEGWQRQDGAMQA